MYNTYSCNVNGGPLLCQLILFNKIVSFICLFICLSVMWCYCSWNCIEMKDWWMKKWTDAPYATFFNCLLFECENEIIKHFSGYIVSEYQMPHNYYPSLLSFFFFDETALKVNWNSGTPLKERCESKTIIRVRKNLLEALNAIMIMRRSLFCIKNVNRRQRKGK